MNLTDARAKIPGLEGMNDATAFEAIHSRFYADMDPAVLAAKLNYTPEPAKTAPRNWGQAASDVGRAAAAGVGGVVKGAGTLYGLATGDMENGATELGDSVQDYWTQGQSQQLKDKRAARSGAIDAADGQLSKAGVALWETVTDPALAMDAVAGNMATLVPGMAAGRLAAGVSAARGLAAASKMGPASAVAREAIAKSAGSLGTKVAIGTGAVQQGADVTGGVYEAAMNKPDSAWMENAEFMAEVAKTDLSLEAIQATKHTFALAAARATMPAATAISVAANAIPGADMLERALVGGGAREVAKAGASWAIPKAMAKAGLGEMAQEAIEEGGGTFAGNVAKQHWVDPEQELGEKVGENAGMGAAGGLLMGSAGGAFHGHAPGNPETEAETETADPLASLRTAAQQPGSVLSRAALAGSLAVGSPAAVVNPDANQPVTAPDSALTPEQIEAEVARLDAAAARAPATGDTGLAAVDPIADTQAQIDAGLAQAAKDKAAQRAAGVPAAETEADPMQAQADEVVKLTRTANVSTVQRHLKIGYNRAARLVENMELAGLVGPMASDGTRQVLQDHDAAPVLPEAPVSTGANQIAPLDNSAVDVGNQPNPLRYSLFDSKTHQDGDVHGAGGQPFNTEGAARLILKKHPGATLEQFSNGFVIRRPSAAVVSDETADEVKSAPTQEANHGSITPAAGLDQPAAAKPVDQLAGGRSPALGAVPAGGGESGNAGVAAGAPEPGAAVVAAGGGTAAIAAEMRATQGHWDKLHARADKITAPAVKQAQMAFENAEIDAAAFEAVIASAEKGANQPAATAAPAQQKAGPARDQAIVKATSAAKDVLTNGGTETDANRAATDLLIGQMAGNPGIRITIDAPAAVKAAKQHAAAPADPAQAAPETVVPAAPAPAAPPSKPKPASIKQRIESERTARADYFTPGNIVSGYDGHDEVLSYTPPKSDGSGWSVKVRSVVNQDGKWIADPKDGRERIHSTQPDAKKLASGPTQRVQVAPAAVADKDGGHIGRDNKPLSEGGKPFKTKDEASAARKLQPMLRVVPASNGKGFALAPKTEAQLAAQDKAAKRLSLARTGKAGVPTAAHEFIAGEGGMDADTKTEFSFGNNPRVGNRTLFAGARGGMSIEAATEKLIEARYLSAGASHSDTVALINRSFTQPQYTVDGTEVMAEAAHATRFEDHLAAQQEAAQNDNFDPFAPLTEQEYTAADMAGTGYAQASAEIQQEVAALSAQLDAMGIDAEEIRMDIATQNSQATNHEYYELTKAAITNAINEQAAVPRGRGDTGQNDGEQGQPAPGREGQEAGLTAPSRAEILAQQERTDTATKADAAQRRAQDLADKRERERKDIAKASEAAADTFVLGGDAEQNLSGQKDIFGGSEFTPPVSKTEITKSAAQSGTPPAGNDRNAFTLERLNSETGKMEPVTFTRGEYIRYKLGHGEIDGISQAKREFSVDGLWYPFGFAYKAERPEAIKPATVPLSKAIEAVNKKHGAGLTDADAVPTPATILDAETNLWSRITDGAATVAEFKAGFENWVSSKPLIIEALSKNKKDDLLKMGGSMFAYRNKSETKPEIVEALWRDGTNQYVLARSFSHGMGKNAWLDGVRNMVNNTDAEQLAQYVTDRKAAQEDAVARVGKLAEAIKDPKTKDDFQHLMRATMSTGKSFKEARMMLTPAQREQYDDLVATETRATRASRKESEQDASLRAPGEAVTATEIIQTRHTKHGHDLWQFNLDQRVSGDEFKSLVAQAKRLGGDYSSYRGNGAIPGWQFHTEDAANAFKALIAGDTSAAKDVMQERRDAFADDRSQSAAERLTEMAYRLDEQADASLSQERKANTHKRASQAASAEAAANTDKAMAKTMRNIAKSITEGSAKFLDRVRQKVQASLLQGYVARAKYDELRAKHDSYTEQERHKGEAPTGETADFAEFPTYTASRSDLASLARQLLEVDGTKLLGQRLLKEADDVTDSYLAFAKENFGKLAAFSTKGGGTAAFGTRADAEASIARSGYKGKAIAYQVKRGEHAVILSPSEAIERGTWKGDGDKRITLTAEVGAELVEKIGKAARRGAKVSVPWQLESAHDRRKALTRMGIETPAEFRAALREFIGLQEQTEAPSKVKQLERAMVGRRNDGMDFFPTPESVADEMVAAAGIEPGMTVLEPSAGWGHIAERIQAAGVDPDVGEMSNDRRELLEAKGFNVVGRDFMDMSPRGFTYGDVFKHTDGRVGILGSNGGLGSSRYKLYSLDGERRNFDYVDRDDLTGVEKRGSLSGYDRILMNPPFSDGRDIQHVQHAYTLLKPGGRIVAIMGESAFSNQSKRATEFREWLESVGGTEEKLDEGTFNDPSLPVNTGANARMVVIERASKQDGAMDFQRQPPVMFSRSGVSVAIPASKWLPDTVIANEVENRISQFAHQPPVKILDTAIGFLPGATGNSDITGAVHGGVIYLFRDQLPSLADVQRTLFHEMLHYGLRRFLTKDEFIGHMLKIYQRDAAIKNEADLWAATAAGKAAEKFGGPEYALARGVDEALAILAEPNQGDSLMRTAKEVWTRRVTTWLANMADAFGMMDAAANLRGMKNVEAREFIKSVFQKLNKDAQPSSDRWDFTADTAFSGRPTRGTPVSQVQATVDAITAHWANAPEVVVVSDMQDAKVPQRVREADQLAKSQGAEGEPDGFIYKGTVYLVASELPTINDAVRVLMHESLGHSGLRGIFGNTLKPILNQVAAMRRADIVTKAREYGLLNLDTPRGATVNEQWQAMTEKNRQVAAEEVLAVMAQTQPELGFVKRAVAAIRNWLRTNVPGFKSMLMTDADIIQAFILPARRHIEGGQAKAIQPIHDANLAALSRSQAPTDPDIRYSRATVARYAKHATDKLNETFSHPGGMSLWDKTVGSMYHLAERNPPFKRVFDAAQAFIQDVSFYATEAADLAPKILPKLDTWKDMLKTPVSAADNKAISAPILQGTLSWARDESGKPVLLDELEATYGKLSDEAKAQMLLKKRIVTEDQLKRWKASPLDIYEGAVRNRFNTAFLTAGVVWKDAELQSMFNLTPAQISLYREFRAATDASLDNLAKADLLRFGGKDVAHLTDMVMDASTADEASVLLRDYLHSQRDLMPERVDDLTAAAGGMIERADKVNKLKAQGYAPLSRFGRYSVDVVVDGKREYFGLFESKAASNLMALKMKQEYGAASVAQGTMSQKEFELFQGITPESLELFGNMLGLDSTGNEAQDQAFQTYLKLTKTNRSAMKRMIHRKGTAGFSEDIGRVLAAFVYSNARQTSAALHMGELGDSVQAIPKGQGELKDAAVELSDYIKKPREEAQALRGLLFAQYLGGSVASAFVNFTQPLTVSFPYLSMYGGAKQSGAALAKAMHDQRAGVKLEDGLRQALHQAEEEGTVSPQSVHELMAQAQGRSTLNSGDGTAAGDALAGAKNNLAKLAIGWGKLFGLAEQINRRSTFIAAYRIAVAQNIANPAAFAIKAVNETQFISNKANKAKFARGAIGATLMTFKSYSTNYLELLHRMATQNGPEGKKAAALMLGMLFLMAGAGGLPFDDDLEDVADGFAQLLGYNFSSKKAKQEFLEDLFGPTWAGFIEKGITGLPGSPLDVSGRMSMGNLIPGTGFFLQKRDHTGDVQELFGPVGGLIKQGRDGLGKLLSGEFIGAAKAIAPKAVSNALKGADMASTGAYNDDKGYKVLATTPFEAAMKAIGFQPHSVAEVQQSNYLHQRARDFYTQHAQDINARWARGIYESDPGQVADARAMVQSWNENNPEQPIRANLPAILKRVHEMRKDKAQRIADTAPKAMRAQIRRDVAEDRVQRNGG